jgi:hypothetical protein
MISGVLFLAALVLSLNISLYIAFNISNDKPERRPMFFLVSFYMVCASSVLITGFLSVLSPLGILVLLSLGNCIILWRKNTFSYLKESTISLSLSDAYLVGGSVVLYYFLTAIISTVWISIDDSTYHAALPALWVKFGTFFVKGSTYQQFFPLNGSLFSAFFLLFFKSEYTASISEVILALICFFSIDSLIREKRTTKLSFFMMFVFFLSLDVQKYLQGFSDSDVMPGVMFLVAYVILSSSYYCFRQYLFAAFILGFLVGVKLTNLFFVLPFFYYLLTNKKHYSLKCFFVFVATFFVGASPWYFKNLFLLNNPIYPFQKFGLPGIFGQSLTEISSLLGIWENISSDDKISFVFGLFGWQPLAWIPSVILILCIIFNIIKNKKISIEILLFIISGVVFTYFYIGAPFSGLNESLGLNINSSRYYLPLLLPMLIISSRSINTDNVNKKLKYISFGLLGIYAIAPRIYDKKTLVCLAIIVGLIFLKRKLPFKQIKVNFFILLVFFISVINFYSAPKAEKAKSNSFWYYSFINNNKNKENKIAMFDNFVFRSYYLFGKNLANTPVRLNFMGEVISELGDEKYIKNYIYLDIEPVISKEFCDIFTNNIIKSGVDYLIIGRGPKGKMPKQNCQQLGLHYPIVHNSNDGIIYSKVK